MKSGPAAGAVLLSLAAIVSLSACRRDAPASDYVARVGDRQLTREELVQRLNLVQGDTASLRPMVVDQWVADALLLEAAEQEGIRRQPDVQRQLAQNEQAVIVGAYLDGYLRSNPPEISPAQIEAYFSQHRENLRLREPYVRFKLVSLPAPSLAQQARTDALRASPDTLWHRYTGMSRNSLLQGTVAPEREVLADRPMLRDALLRLRPGQASPVVVADSLYHVLYLIQRYPEGALPELDHVRDEIVQRLTLEARKQIVQRHVEQLRAEARAGDRLDVR